MNNQFNQFEQVYFVSDESRHYEILEGKVWDDLGNGLYEILYNGKIYEVNAFQVFKYDQDCKEEAKELANNLSGIMTSNYHTWIADPNLVSHKEYFESVIAEFQLVQEKKTIYNITTNTTCNEQH